MSNIIYDNIGTNYISNRRTDPKIAEKLYAELQGATKIINIGAGAGSYEPENIDLIAVEPSTKMINQRRENAHPVLQAFAEDLPFDDNSFSHAMTILSIHHWKDRKRAFNEINRVVTDKFVAITWDPAADPFWLTRDYFPEIIETDYKIFHAMEEFDEYFDGVKVQVLEIPSNCQDGFLAAFWKRPETYLDENVRQSISSFSKIDNPIPGLAKLKDDLSSGKWIEKNQDILDKDELDAGYRLVTCKIKK